MEGDSIWGSKDCQVPEYFNFADVLDEWAQKEEVTRYCRINKILTSASAQKTMNILSLLSRPRNALPDDPAKEKAYIT